MSNQLPRAFAISFATSASKTTSIDLGGGYLYVAVEVPGTINTMFGAASTPFWVLGSNDNVTFRRYAEILTSTVTNDFIIASSVSNRVVSIPYFASRYIMIEASATVTGAVVPPTFKIVCTDSL